MVFEELSFGGKYKLADTIFKPNNMNQVMVIEKLSEFNLLKEDVKEVG